MRFYQEKRQNNSTKSHGIFRTGNLVLKTNTKISFQHWFIFHSSWIFQSTGMRISDSMTWLVSIMMVQRQKLSLSLKALDGCRAGRMQQECTVRKIPQNFVFLGNFNKS